MKEHQALMKILNEYIGISSNDLSALEKRVLAYASSGTGLYMPINQFGEFINPRRI
jgi:hypothetical protein